MTFKLIVISSAVPVPGETALVKALFENGLRHFHLRKKGMSADRMRRFLHSIPSRYHPRIVIHSHHILAREFNLAGIHYPVKQRDRMKVARMKKKLLSTSFHLKGDAVDPAAFDQLLMSPVFDSISKKGHKGQFSAANWKLFIKDYAAIGGKKAKLIALGGIDTSNILKVKRAGFDGAALLGAIWQSKDPVSSFRKIRSKIN